MHSDAENRQWVSKCRYFGNWLTDWVERRRWVCDQVPYWLDKHTENSNQVDQQVLIFESFECEQVIKWCPVMGVLQSRNVHLLGQALLVFVVHFYEGNWKINIFYVLFLEGLSYFVACETLEYRTRERRDWEWGSLLGIFVWCFYRDLPQNKKGREGLCLWEGEKRGQCYPRCLRIFGRRSI